MMQGVGSHSVTDPRNNIKIGPMVGHEWFHIFCHGISINAAI